MNAQRCDRLIVGSGTASCVLANALSADPTRRPLMLDAVGAGNDKRIHIPADIVAKAMASDGQCLDFARINGSTPNPPPPAQASTRATLEAACGSSTRSHSAPHLQRRHP